MSEAGLDRTPEALFEHAALIVDSDETLRALLVPAIHRSLAAGEDVLVVVNPMTEQVLRDALGLVARRLEWGDTGAFYQRLGFAFESFHRYLAKQHDEARRVHVIAEPDLDTDLGPETAVDRVAAFLSYESMCNEAYAGYGCPVTCLWDSRRHPTLVIENVRSLHNHELTAAGATPNPDFIAPDTYLAGRNDIVLEPPPAQVDLDLTLNEPDAFASLRARLRDWTAAHRFAPYATEDVLVAVLEVVTNGFEHGKPPVRVRCWNHFGTLLAEIEDRGGRPIPPKAGYRNPAVTGERALGLWLTRQLADAVTTHADGHRTLVRLHFPYLMTHRNPPSD